MSIQQHKIRIFPKNLFFTLRKICILLQRKSPSTYHKTEDTIILSPRMLFICSLKLSSTQRSHPLLFSSQHLVCFGEVLNTKRNLSPELCRGTTDQIEYREFTTTCLTMSQVPGAVWRCQVICADPDKRRGRCVI